MNDRNVTGIGTPPFTHFIQFRPDGQAGVNADTPSRYIRVGLDKRGGQKDRNRVILRLSGNNGTVTMLREEDGISTQ